MTRVFFALVALMISLWVFSAPPARGTEITLRAQLEVLATKYGFVISGLDHISAGAAQRSVEGNVEDRLKSLLEDYNHVVTAPSPGKIEKIIITSLKQPSDKRYVSPYVVTTRVGTQHRVQAIITGPNNQGRDVELVVDTGASTVVLPASMSTQLGFRPEDLVDGIAQTASDRKGQARGPEVRSCGKRFGERHQGHHHTERPSEQYHAPRDELSRKVQGHHRRCA
jgi:aspartyl protease family protein